MHERVKCPLCSGTGEISIPARQCQKGPKPVWIIPWGIRDHFNRTDAPCLLCVEARGVVPAHVATAFLFRYQDFIEQRAWIPRSAFEAFLIEIGWCGNLHPPKAKFRRISNDH